MIVLPSVWGQNGNTSLQKQMEEIRSLCHSMQEENDLLKAEIRSRDSLAYTRLRLQIFEAFNTVPRLNFDFIHTTDKIAVTGLFTKLLQANNPTSDILGFRFNDVILETSEKYFLVELKSEPERTRFSQVIHKLVNNPVISVLANSNPITSVTAAIISTVAGFSSTSVQVEKEGSHIKNVAATTKDAFSQKNIEGFRLELQPYIEFYDALNTASSRYISNLKSINQKYNYLKAKVDAVHSQLFASIAISDSNTWIMLTQSLPDPGHGNTNFEKYIINPQILNCAAIAAGIPSLDQSVKEFRKEYELSLYSFLKEYILALQSAKKLSPSSIDHSKIDKLIAEIELFIQHELQQEAS